MEEFDESEVLWGCAAEEAEESKKPMHVPTSRWSRRKRSGGSKGKSAEKEQRIVVCSLADWSSTKIGNGGRNSEDDDDDEEEDDGGEVIPPHEYLLRQRRRNGVVSFSVHEGVGRTLKGRDLSRVRNAVWAKFGFQD